MALLFFGNVTLAQTAKTKSAKEYRAFPKGSGSDIAGFDLPEGFKEVTKTDDNKYDYAIAIPEGSFEIRFKINPHTEGTSDSLYIERGKTLAKELAGDNMFYIKDIPPTSLSDYNADAGKVYFMSLPDSPTTNHYKYALLTVLQKNRKGIIMAVCITNDRGPDMFKNIYRAKSCIKFKDEQ
ncbi:hypothetical protein [Mucilaginibacter myungsuensis]|uniref:Uncharacterized protein n=1 Tax=Mucilaginibacter myungsuensis TaxID=649104 RepID=A0A929KY09_9SPHI|nr:hypothetical protein [Mucilaginibacter myungsuensis]MBE9662605.1 hypothetical protein [Mucilaginibacter myungsuensis]MDN3598025.1 hypothetical protein [Mucilaginibacter myungsuensis]